MNNHLNLSAAIRAGAALRPQATGMFFQYNYGKLCSCALGAAYEAVTGKQTMPDALKLGGGSIYLSQRFPLLNRTLVFGEQPEPVQKPGVSQTVSTVIIDLNDNHQWSREQIADWLEQFERTDSKCVAVETERGITTWVK